MIRRRDWIRGALAGSGGVALGLPFLEALAPKKALAQGIRPQRFIVIHTPQGIDGDVWVPQGEGSFTLPAYLQPLERHRSRLVPISGVSNYVKSLVDPTSGNSSANDHQAAGFTLMSATAFRSVTNADGTFRGGAGAVTAPYGPSIDQVVASRISAGTRFPSLFYKVGGDGTGENTMFYAGRAGESMTAISGEPDPAAAYGRLIAADPTPGGTSEPAPVPTPAPTPEIPDLATRLRNRRSRALDASAASLARLQREFVGDDASRLEAHADFVRDVERRLPPPMMPGTPGTPAIPGAPGMGMGCRIHTPALPGEYRPNSNFDHLTSPAQIDNAVLALSCDLTRVVAIQFTDYHGPTFPFLEQPIPGRHDSWHTMVHSQLGSEDTIRRSVFRFYAEQVAHLLDRLAAVDEGDSTLLDNTVVLWISEFGQGGSHDSSNLPVFLAGGGGGLRGGRHIAAPGRSTNDVFTSVLHLFGGDDDGFGLRNGPNGPISRGPIGGLT